MFFALQYSQKNLSLLWLILICHFAYNQNDWDYVGEEALKLEDRIYLSTIKTVQLHKSDWELSPPVLEMNSNDELTLSFDELEGKRKNYVIKFVHCNADWTKSDLMESEYMEGFPEINIINFKFSSNTMQAYIHYTVNFPTSNVRFRLSGNYVVYVVEMENPTKPVLSRRFFVCQPMVSLEASVRQGFKSESVQQLEMRLNVSRLTLNNPEKEIKVVIFQNLRWDNASYFPKPTYYAPGELIYSLNEAAAFEGGNEFRYVDLRSTRQFNERVVNYSRDAQMKTHVFLTDEINRSRKPYVFYPDFNGNFVIQNRDFPSSIHTEADYMWVHFFIPYKEADPNGTFYWLGKATDWKINPNYKFIYNEDKRGYECKLYLKQGFYSYLIIYEGDNSDPKEKLKMEGSFWDTENDYYILVYYRKFGTFYDQLLSFKSLKSFRR
ncbi:MAG: DUF5103 domain-containing protein [Bacteroidia bacterium]|nr:DUF5103 domain-containing protein [Bacteroidia bacterium]